MKKAITVFALTFFIATLYSQATLSFCTFVDAEGYCAFNNTKFITTPDSTTGRIFMKIKSATPLGGKLTYKIFKVDKAGKETLSESLDQTIQPDWLLAWQPMFFATDTKYNVQVTNDAGKLICSKQFELLSFK